MVSLVDVSKATAPRSWRTAVTSCRRPRNASSASNLTLSTGQNDYRKYRKYRKFPQAGSQCHTHPPADVSTPS